MPAVNFNFHGELNNFLSYAQQAKALNCGLGQQQVGHGSRRGLIANGILCPGVPATA
jgi:hypothetical protein